MTAEEKEQASDKVESRLARLELNFKILLALILISLSASLVALIVALVVLLIT
jgi:hypothetical protein